MDRQGSSKNLSGGMTSAVRPSPPPWARHSPSLLPSPGSLKLSCVHRSPGDLVKMEVLTAGQGSVLKLCLASQFPGDATSSVKALGPLSSQMFLMSNLSC